MLLFKIVLTLVLAGVAYGEACSFFWTWRIRRAPIRKSRSIESMDLPTEEACTQACEAITPLLCASHTYNEGTQECLLNIYRWRLSRRGSAVKKELCPGCDFSWTSGADKRLLKGVNGRTLTGKMSELDCQARCEEQTGFHCASVNYNKRKEKCHLLLGSASDMQVSPFVHLSRSRKFTYYDRELVCQDCSNHGCQNGATCSPETRGYTCVCGPGYTGDYCEIGADDCIGHQCENGGACVDGDNEYTCTCAPGYAGEFCTENIDDCVGHQCQNEATCVDGVNGYTCACAPGYRGERCGENIDDCVGHQCLNGATCSDGVNGYTCTCEAGYRGERCGENIDECVGHQCLNGATCLDGVNGYTCDCAPGFSGERCFDNIDDCPGNRCENGATCVDGVNAYTCTCATGYSGASCEKNINDCPGHNCLNGATCVDGLNTYTCACAEGYIGARCGDLDPAKIIIKGIDQTPALVLYFNTAAVELYRDTGTGVLVADLIVFNPSAVDGYETIGQQAQRNHGPFTGSITMARDLLADTPQPALAQSPHSANILLFPV